MSTAKLHPLQGDTVGSLGYFFPSWHLKNQVRFSFHIGEAMVSLPDKDKTQTSTHNPSTQNHTAPQGRGLPQQNHGGAPRVRGDTAAVTALQGPNPTSVWLSNLPPLLHPVVPARISMCSLGKTARPACPCKECRQRNAHHQQPESTGHKARAIRQLRAAKTLQTKTLPGCRQRQREASAKCRSSPGDQQEISD